VGRLREWPLRYLERGAIKSAATSVLFRSNSYLAVSTISVLSREGRCLNSSKSIYTNLGVVVYKKSWISSLLPSVRYISFSLLLPPFLMSCAAIDTVDDRALTMNQSVNRYRNNAILDNIVRSSKNEPLNFAAVSGIVGHNTVQIGLPGTPSINLTPKITAGSESATTGQYSFSNDFTFTEVDDAATTQALATPLDPATMANFFQRGLPSDFLMLLFINKIRIADSNGNIIGDFYPGALSEDCEFNDSSCPIRSTLEVFTWLAVQGLTFRTEKGAIPGQSKSPQAQICFEPGLQAGIYKRKFLSRYHRINFSAFRPAKPYRQKMTIPALVSPDTKHASYCNDAKTWLNPPSAPAPTSSTQVCVNSTCDTKKAAPSASNTSAAYQIYDAQDDVWIEIYTRSTFGIYDFLGNQLTRPTPVRLLSTSLILFNVNHGTSDCFAQVTDGISYCVPNQDADLTKAAFSIVHQLAALYTSAVSSAPITSTVRITP
jgi:hypothetical protein